MFSNPEIKAIYCAHGGDTASQILSLINYEAIKKNPKIFLGMSDIDVLHLAINTKTKLVIFHGSDPKSGRPGKPMDLDIEYTWQNFQNRIINKSKEVLASSERICIRKGIAEGKIIGCNLSSILKLAGTPFFPNFENSILFLEGYSEKKICEQKIRNKLFSEILNSYNIRNLCQVNVSLEIFSNS